MGWTWQYGPWREGPQGELKDAKNKTFTVTADDVATVSFDVDSQSRHFPNIIPLTTDIWVVQDGDDCPFRGRALGRSGTLTASRASRTQAAVGYKALAVAADMGDVWLTEWNDQPTDIAWAAVLSAQTQPGSNFAGVVRGPVRGGRNIDVSLSPYVSLDENLTTVCQQVNGSWDITPVTVDEQRFDYWPGGTRGTDRGIVIDLGGRAVSASDQVAVDGYGNQFTNLGQPLADGDAIGWIRTAQVPDLATRPEGRWARISTSSAQKADSAVQAEANTLLAKGQIVPITWTAELARGFWQGRQHLWPGDPITWVAKVPAYDLETGRLLHMAYDVEETHVVDQLTADFSTSPDEPKVTIQFGAPAPTDRRRRLRVDQSLAALARRG